jgi:hypothetical protein
VRHLAPARPLGAFVEAQRALNRQSATRGDRIQGDLAENRALWTGSWLADYVFWIRNNHAILGVCAHHPLHPYSTLERMWVLVLQVVLTACVNIAQSVGRVGDRAENRRDRDEGRKSREEAERREETLDVYDEIFRTIGLPLAATAFAFVFKQFAICRCVQRREASDARALAEWSGYFLMGLASIGVLGFAVGMFTNVTKETRDEAYTVLTYTLPVSLALSWAAYQPVVLSLVFGVKRWHERREVARAAAKGEPHAIGMMARITGGLGQAASAAVIAVDGGQ